MDLAEKGSPTSLMIINHLWVVSLDSLGNIIMLSAWNRLGVSGQMLCAIESMYRDLVRQRRVQSEVVLYLSVVVLTVSQSYSGTLIAVFFAEPYPEHSMAMRAFLELADNKLLFTRTAP